MTPSQYRIHYGKSNVSVYRTHAAPLVGVPAIPESAFTGRPNTLFAADVDVRVLGGPFLPAYTEGDNRAVVATDTMKNFILREALAFGGATLEGFLGFLGRRFLATYPQMGALRLEGRELPFTPAVVPGGADFEPSEALFSRSRDDFATAMLELERAGEGVTVRDHRSGRAGLQLIKITGSSFARFARDDYTTLPEVVDRPLYIHLDIHWRYADVTDAEGADAGRYVPAEQVADLVRAVFHRFNSQSIQHLVHEMGLRMLERFPRLAEVGFEAQNRLWDTAFASEADGRVKAYCDPRPPYGQVGLTMRREG